MRKAEEIAKKYKNLVVAVTKEEFIRVIKQIQLEAIDEAVKRCAESVEFTYAAYEYEIPKGSDFVGDIEYGWHYIDKSSILKVADQLLKELK